MIIKLLNVSIFQVGLSVVRWATRGMKALKSSKKRLFPIFLDIYNEIWREYKKNFLLLQRIWETNV